MILALTSSAVLDRRPTGTAVNFQFWKLGWIWRAGYQVPHTELKSSFLYTWVRASWIKFNKCPTRYDLLSLLHFCRQLYMFRVLTPIMSSYNCNYSFWYWLTGSTTIRSRRWVGTDPVYYIYVGSSTCFGCWHPSSGARTTVSGW